ncbi:protein-export chaperone SecB [Thomasclavelia cocleata]|jgi:preprotein translocase subunit SecB|uniref:protein-export chaperone SecB n=1 Tax=Thomasclavelia cocleata TaxID=69824 RepID=UPI0025759249|nr:protein-export chaperone SecB [Thomasclavelia cocleata]
MSDKKLEKSSLQLLNLFFEKIEFLRTGNHKDNEEAISEKETKFKLNSTISTDENDTFYKVKLTIFGEKIETYKFEISIVGIFTFDMQEPIDKEVKETVINKNTIAILMPYLRSQVSLLTAQPGIDCIVLPPFNINSIF